MIFYVIGYKVALYQWNTTAADSTNSLSSLSDLTIHELLHDIKNGYLQFLGFFFGNDAGVGTATQLCNLLLTCLAVFILMRFLLQRKIPIINGLIVAGCVLLLPVLMLLMSIFMSKEAISYRTAYALFLLYPMMLSVVFHWGDGGRSEKVGTERYISGKPVTDGTASGKSEISGQDIRKIETGEKLSGKIGNKEKNGNATIKIGKVHVAAIVAVCIILCQNIIYSNGAYTVQKILYDRTVSIMTRVLEDVEEEEGYVVGETEVVVIGGIYDKDSTVLELTSKYSALGGFKKTSVSYRRTFGSMAKLLGSELNLADDSVREEYQQMEEVQEMPAYPQDGYCRMVDGKLVVKLSE